MEKIRMELLKLLALAKKPDGSYYIFPDQLVEDLGPLWEQAFFVMVQRDEYLTQSSYQYMKEQFQKIKPLMLTILWEYIEGNNTFRKIAIRNISERLGNFIGKVEANVTWLPIEIKNPNEEILNLSKLDSILYSDFQKQLNGFELIYCLDKEIDYETYVLLSKLGSIKDYFRLYNQQGYAKEIEELPEDGLFLTEFTKDRYLKDYSTELIEQQYQATKEELLVYMNIYDEEDLKSKIPLLESMGVLKKEYKRRMKNE